MEQQVNAEKKFDVIKWWTNDYLSMKKVSFVPEYLLSELKAPELSDARCLVRMIKKEVDEYNAKLKTKQKLLKNYHYKKNYMESSLFAGLPIPILKIQKLIEEHPNKTAYEIFRLIS